MTARLSARIRGRCLTVAIGVAMVVAAACSDIPTDPKIPFAIEFNRAPSPSVVLGQDMFDSLGIVRPLRAIVFNSKGDSIPGAAVTYHAVAGDSVPFTVNPTTGQVTGKAAPAFAGKIGRVYAQAGGLQSQTIPVTATRSADALIAIAPLDTDLVLRFTTTDPLPLSRSFSVRLRHTPVAGEAAGDTLVPAYLVRFRIVQPAAAATDTSYLMLTNGDRKRSELDTTDANGVASRIVRVRRVNFPFSKPAPGDTIVDTITIRASAVRQNGTPVPTSGADFRLFVKARKQ